MKKPQRTLFKLLVRPWPLLWVLLSMSMAGEALASNQEDNGRLLQELTTRLQDNLDREDALPHYREAYARWLLRAAKLRKILDTDPTKFEQMLTKAVHGLKMSHLSFGKMPEGTLGLEIVQGSDGSFRVAAIAPGGPAFQAGIALGDSLLELDGRVPMAQEEPVQPELSSSWLALRRKDGREYKVKLVRASRDDLLMGKLGITTQTQEKGTLLVRTVLEHSNAHQAGIRKGDVILEIDGEVPRSRLDRGFRPGEVARLRMQNPGSEVRGMQVTLQSEADLKAPKFEVVEIKHAGGEKAVFLSLPSFAEYYDPQVVHRALDQAEQEGLLLVDLRNNGGGRSDHFLSYLLSPGTPLCSQVGARFASSEARSLRTKMSGLLSQWKTALKTLVDTHMRRRKQKLLPRKSALLRDFDEWKEKTLDATKSFHLLPQRLRPVLEERREKLVNLLEDGPDPCLNDSTDDWDGWIKETIAREEEVLSAPLVQSQECRVPLDPSPSRWRNFTGIWAHLPQQPSFPYHGQVVFLVNENTACSAEICALVPMEYQELRDKGLQRELSHQGQLWPRSIDIIGTTKGLAQGQGMSRIKVPGGTYRLTFPLYDIITSVKGREIEKHGIGREDGGPDLELVKKISTWIEDREIID